MSFTHGDVDYEYLERLAVGPDGRRRFDRLSFAAHFDMLMFGRRGIERPPDERFAEPVPGPVRGDVRAGCAGSTACGSSSPTT